MQVNLDEQVYTVIFIDTLFFGEAALTMTIAITVISAGSLSPMNTVFEMSGL